MKFDEAIELVNSGKAVKRESWDEAIIFKGVFNYNVDGKVTNILKRYERSYSPYFENDDDYNADDWKLVI